MVFRHFTRPNHLKFDSTTVHGAVKRARPQQHVFHGVVVTAPFLAIAPILRRQLPTLIWRILALLESLQLFFRTDLQPELHHDPSGVHKLPLEIVDLAISPLPGVLVAESLHPHYQTRPYQPLRSQR